MMAEEETAGGGSATAQDSGEEGFEIEDGGGGPRVG
jgi:hypothetical protein